MGVNILKRNNTKKISCWRLVAPGKSSGGQRGLHAALWVVQLHEFEAEVTTDGEPPGLRESEEPISIQSDAFSLLDNWLLFSAMGSFKYALYGSYMAICACHT